MTNQTRPAPTFRPVPAVPIVVLLDANGLRAVRTHAGVFAGATFSEAVAAATQEKP